MFKINFRIVDDFEELRYMEPKFFDNEWHHITGLFQICFGDQKEGSYYHENVLGDEETGSELLDYWFECLLNVVSLLDTKTNYVAFKEIETTKKWLEFSRINDEVIINTAIDVAENNNQILLTEKYNHFSYIEPLNFTITMSELKQQIVNATINFLDEIQKLNSKLVNTQMVLELFEKIIKAKDTHSGVEV